MNFGHGEQGEFLDEVFKDTINVNGERKSMLDDFQKTGVLSTKAQTTPFFGEASDKNGPWNYAE